MELLRRIYNYQHFWIIAILVLGAALRLYRLDYQSVWMDEIYTLNITNPGLSLKQMLAEVYNKDGFPGLYYLLLRLFYIIFDYSELTARLLSAFAGIAGIYAIYIFGKEIHTKNTGLFAAFLLSINDFHILYSQEARSYSLFFLVAVVAFYRLSVFISNPTLKNAIWYGLSAGLILNINFFGLITIFSQALLLLLLIAASPAEKRLQTFKYAAISGLITILLFLPNFKKFVQLSEIKSFWVPPPLPDTFTSLFKELLGSSEITMFAYGLIFIYFLLKVLNKKTTEVNLLAVKKDRETYSFIILFAWIVPFVAIVVIKAFTGTSFTISRYFMSIVPVLLVALAIGLQLIRNRFVRVILVLSIFFFSITNLVVVKKYYTAISKTQFREISQFIEVNNTNNAPVYTSVKYWYDYFLDNEKVKTNLIELSLEDHVGQMMQDSTKIKPFWYADAHLKPYQLSAAAETFLNTHFFINNNLEGFDAWTRYYNLKSNDTRVIDLKRFQPLQQVNGDPFPMNIETFENDGTNVKVYGWAFFEKQSAAQSTIDIVLIKDETVIKLQTQRIIRPDIAPYFKLSDDLNNAGFSSIIALASIPSGNYRVGIYLMDSSTKKEGLLLTDRYVNKE